MEFTFSKRKLRINLLFLVVLSGIVLVMFKIKGYSLAEIAGFDSGRDATLAGAQAFYTVDFHQDADHWAAQLCQYSTQPACAYYQDAVAPFLWPAFIADQTVVNAQISEPILLADKPVEGEANPIQIWQVRVTLSDPWPQGDGRTNFPAHVLVVRKSNGWKFERFLLADEITRYTGGK